MKLYLAAPYNCLNDMPQAAEMFEAAGHTITERWWDHESDPTDFDNPKHFNLLEDRATRDFMGVVQADALVVLNYGKSEGKAVEMGVAISRFIPIILVGKRTNIFHFIPSVHPVKDVAAAVKVLAVRSAFNTQIQTKVKR